MHAHTHTQTCRQKHGMHKNHTLSDMKVQICQICIKILLQQSQLQQISEIYKEL